MSTKKCACFTPSGLVYTRLETDGTIARRPLDLQKENITRNKRSINNDVFEPNTVDTILEENPSIGHLSFKNEPIDELEKSDIEYKIDKLIKETEAFLKAYERTKENIDHKRIKRRAQNFNHNKHKHKNDPMLNNNESSLECKIEKDGQVNCSQVIYNDLKAWHTNRLSLEDQIRELKTKLEDLKEIKRHLKISKPVLEMQTISPSYSILHNNTALHETINKDTRDGSRKSRLHRVKTKHRNGTFDKKFRQSNEYIIPTVNANTKDDIFNMQIRNETSTETVLKFLNVSDFTSATNQTYIIEEPKPQTTTVVTDSESSPAKQSSPSITTNFYDVTTETVRNHTASETKNDKEINEWKTTSSDFFTALHYYSTSADKVISTHRPTTIHTVVQKIRPSNKSKASTLGPKRLDASEYEQRNPNKGNNNNGIFTNPPDVFQRRLHPLFIENEDKHVCYCEENR